jgi:hypothetical protein
MNPFFLVLFLVIYGLKFSLMKPNILLTQQNKIYFVVYYIGYKGAFLYRQRSGHILLSNIHIPYGDSLSLHVTMFSYTS